MYVTLNSDEEYTSLAGQLCEHVDNWRSYLRLQSVHTDLLMADDENT